MSSPEELREAMLTSAVLLSLACRPAQELPGGADSSPESSPEGYDGPIQFARRPRNVLVIALDTTRPDIIGRYSGDPEASPALDALLAESVTLDNHQSCSNWTWDSVLCVQTGRDPFELGFAWVDEEGMQAPAPESVELVSETLLEAGYQTALVSGQRFMSRYSGMDQGFEGYFSEDDLDAAGIAIKGMAMLEAMDRERPWYLHLHFMDPHELYKPPPAYLQGLDELPPIDWDLADRQSYELLRARFETLDKAEQELILEHLWVRYRGELRYFDDQLGRLWVQLEAGGWLRDTLVVFWTDHGEQIWQHGYSTHGASLYEEEIRSTAAFWAEGITPMSWTGPTTHKDLWPTIMEVLGLEYPPGFSGLPLGERPDDDPLFALRYRGDKSFQSVVHGGAKLFYRWSGDREYYDLLADPGERDNRYDASDPEVIALWDLLLPEVERVWGAIGGAEPSAPGP